MHFGSGTFMKSQFTLYQPAATKQQNFLTNTIIKIMYLNDIIAVVILYFSAFGAINGELSSNDEVTTAAIINQRGGSRRARNRDRQAVDVQNAYKMSVDDMRSFFENLYDEEVECDVSEYYSLALRTCRSCEGICNSAEKEMKKQCEKLCPGV